MPNLANSFEVLKGFWMAGGDCFDRHSVVAGGGCASARAPVSSNESDNLIENRARLDLFTRSFGYLSMSFLVSSAAAAAAVAKD